MKYVFALVAFAATPAIADVTVRFDEGAPKDRFTVTQTGGCALGPSTITLDLNGSQGGLIFDVTGAGAGVEVFQPFELTSGADYLTALPVISDGDKSVTLSLLGLADGQSISFTIDVDDTLGTRAITVSDSEITGALVTLQSETGSATAAFDQTATATVQVDDCAS